MTIIIVFLIILIWIVSLLFSKNSYTSYNLKQIELQELSEKFGPRTNSPQHFVTYYSIMDKKQLIPRVIEENFDSFANKTNLQLSFFNNDDCLKFIQKNFPTKIVKAYQKLKSKAYQSDLWRLCVLYHCGGLYTDASLKCYSDLEFLNNYDIVLCQDLRKNDIFNAFLFFQKSKHKLLSFWITKIADLILQEEYGQNILDVTGPTRLGKLFFEYYQKEFKRGENQMDSDKVLILHNKKKDSLISIFHKDEMLLQRHRSYNNLRAFLVKHNLTNFYASLWYDRDIYQ